MNGFKYVKQINWYYQLLQNIDYQLFNKIEYYQLNTPLYL
jgi:hypothetical protein